MRHHERRKAGVMGLNALNADVHDELPPMEVGSRAVGEHGEQPFDDAQPQVGLSHSKAKPAPH